MHLLPLFAGPVQPLYVPVPDQAAWQLAEAWLEPDTNRQTRLATGAVTAEPTIAAWVAVELYRVARCWPEATGVAEFARYLIEVARVPSPEGCAVGKLDAKLDAIVRRRWAQEFFQLRRFAESIGQEYAGAEADSARFWTLLHRGIGGWVVPVAQELDALPAVDLLGAWAAFVEAAREQDTAQAQSAATVLQRGFSNPAKSLDWLSGVARRIAVAYTHGADSQNDVSAVQDEWLSASPQWQWFLPQLLNRLQRAAFLEQQFHAAVEDAKLEALREFAYGASHELNNPLANITLRAESLLAEETHPERRRTLANICSQALRASEMISDLMLFARPPLPQRQNVAIRPLIQQVLDDLQPLAQEQGTHLHLLSDVSEDIGVWVDPQQIATAVQAICTNSLEALGSGGAVQVELRVHQPTADPGTGQTVMEIAIRDNGPGLSAHARQHLFDPFFSGREAGRGLGLGLSKCWRIMTLHGGHIQVDSGPLGTTVRLLFPQCAAAQDAGDQPLVDVTVGGNREFHQ